MDLLQAVFNHLVLPPRLPGSQDPDIEAVSYDVLMRIIRACDTLDSLVEPPWSKAYQSLRASFKACLPLHSGRLDKSVLLAYFRELQPDQMLILHVIEQNAALLVRRINQNGEHYVVFEAFETSAVSEHVLAAGHALQWDFPGRSVRLPLSSFANEPFQECLATFLEQASMESLYSLQASAQKANVSITEVRDTTDPALITQMLMSILEAMGSYYQTPMLRKRVRDDVNIQGADLPWRRLPFWLVLRVAAQRHLCLTLGNEQGRICYKLLICLLLADLLKESAGKLNPAMVITLRTKLCRRMAKLEMDKTKSTLPKSLFSQISPLIERVIREATKQIENAWESFKKANTRRVPVLPLYADQHALNLSLPNSGGYLDRLLYNQPPRKAGMASLNLPQPLDKAIQQTQDFTDHIFRLADIESRVEYSQLFDWDNMKGIMTRCIQTAKEIDDVFAEVGTTYESDPEQMSSMILTLFTSWVRLDRCAVTACPLLNDYRRVFRPELLDVLQLPTMSEMRRLQDIQAYLAQKNSKSRYGTIFDRFDNNSLAVRYVAQSDEMRLLGQRIQAASNQARNAKEAEWNRTCKQYDDHTEGFAEGTCCCSWNNGQRDVRGCEACWHARARKRLQIEIHEAFLPENEPARSVLIFELAIPQYLSAYRDATWKILSLLAHPSRPNKSSNPAIELTNCPPLQPYMTAEARGISLASSIKCFSQTHYKFNRGKAPLSRVILPLGAEFRLYDRITGLWVNDLERPLTFLHLCAVNTPSALQATIIPVIQHPSPIVDGPSSYEVQANQVECPANMSVHEFSAYQKLLGGNVRRWPNILVEMGSSNLNIGNEDTARVLCQLAVQAGPRLPDEPLRAAHVIFKEASFVERLAEIIEKRLQAILTNWREHHYMGLLITLALRLFHLSSGSSRDRAETLLKAARNATLEWTTSLSKELHITIDAEAAQRISTYGFCAAILCRRTFAIYTEVDYAMSAEDLSSWVLASIALQENLLVDINKLPPGLKSMLLRDTKMAYHLQPLLKTAIQAHPNAVGYGIARSLYDSSDGIKPTLYKWDFLDMSHNRWIVARVSEKRWTYPITRTVHFNFIEGHMLVNGEPRGKLPLEIQESEDVKEIFGKQHILTYPSSLPGMTHQLSKPISKPISDPGQEVHFGMRDGQVVIRACTPTSVLEFIPRKKFTGPNSFDLPTELTENCVHWLNLSTRCLEVRRMPAIWVKRPRDWEIDVPKRRATRGNVNLVDPRSSVFAQIARTLEYFEQPERLTISQPLKGKLQVELRHLDLKFTVNYDGFLECQQLNAKIDPDQNADTWHGLRSMIVLRDITSGKRSIIVPLGELKCHRNGMHVNVRITGVQNYGRYKIDDVLGRLSCPPEPRLLYTKALYHAMTSFCLPDALTKKTGTEEAFAILSSGASQPWVPVVRTYPILNELAALSPRRAYYPPPMKRLQTVTWNENLNASIQHDGFESLVLDIILKSNQLNKFARIATTDSDPEEVTHLRNRGKMQRQLYECPTLDTAIQVYQDTIYIPRDRRKTSKADHVYEIARHVLTGSSSLQMRTTLKTLLESSEVIGGFHGDSSSLIGTEPLITQIEESVYEQWGSLVQFCRHADHSAPLLFRLGLLAFRTNPNMDLIRSLAAFSLVRKIKYLEPPPYDGFFDFKSRERPPIELLQTLIASAHIAFEPKTRCRSEWKDRAERNAEEHQDYCEIQGRLLAGHLLEQWPVTIDELSTETLGVQVINVPLALDKIRPEWDRRLKNIELEGYIDQVQAVLNSLKGPRDSSALFNWTDNNPVFTGRKNSRVIPSVAQDLVTKTGPDLDDTISDIQLSAGNESAYSGIRASPVKNTFNEATELEAILRRFARTANVIRQKYGNDLLQSLAALKDTGQLDDQRPVPTLKEVNYAIERARLTVSKYHKQIYDALASGDHRFEWLRLGAIWPCTSPTEMLIFLRSISAYNFGVGMKKALVSYGVAITSLQRLERLRSAVLRGDKRASEEELRNPGHQNWSPFKSTDWLLLEIDSDFLIRAEQVDVACAMIAPKSGQNSVLQMNMGKGKTSCIVPMVIAVLADGKNLSRLIVPKALLMQTAQTTQSRLGGLVGREVLHIPFSRKTPTTPEMLELYEKLHRLTRIRRGLILTSHEHVLSYKLGGWQQLADGKLKAARGMNNFQRWLDDNCRDVLDECDFTLAVKTQLNYPSGPEMAVDGHPFRWQVAQELLASVAHYIPNLTKRFPTSIEVLWRSGSFPILHFLKNDVQEAIHDYILESICRGQTTFLRPADSSFRGRQGIIRRVLYEPKLDERIFMQAANAFVNPQVASKILLLVRGLLINRILLLCLNKRWNVQYGLHPGRDPIAVPFEAKGTPSEQSEFGHPDVSILFTCLAFYYTGLTPAQFRQGLQYVLQSDDPAAQYELWSSGCDSLPEALHHWSVINIEDGGQLEELWSHLHLSRVVIDHYCNHFVFPVHARQFEIKLQVSAWDIPLFSKDQRGARTTGFSGTNDGRLNLPLTIRQDDLPSLRQTSAEVLSYLLQRCNRGYQVTTDALGKRLTEIGLLTQLYTKGIRTLIDAGAYILEMDNGTVAQKWLGIDHEAAAAVYFGADNRAWVHYRGDKKSDVPLLATPFVDDLRNCVVYLDEAHTRGVDLKLPPDAHGALTLALKQTKDYTMQAAMRLRQLRTTQSVSFFAPPEVDQSIRDFCRPAKGTSIDSSHVVAWLLEQTCCVNEDLQSLYVAQGVDFCRRTDAIWRHNNFLADPTQRAKLLETIQQPERQTLEQLYGGALAGSRIGTVDRMSTPQLQKFADQLNQSHGERGPLHIGAMEEVEQERELQVQVEQVRQIQKPLRYEALTFPGLHPVISYFARTGVLEHTSSNQKDAAFEHAFTYVARTTLGKQFGVRETDSRIFVSTEFGRTVKCTMNNVTDNFMRPVEWILWSHSTQTALVIIPEEAESLIPLLRTNTRFPRVYLIAYAAPVTKTMEIFNTFKYYTLPALPPTYKFPEWFRFELGILGGRLYVSLAEWNPLSRYIRSSVEEAGESSGGSANSKQANGGTPALFADDPSSFLLEWLTLLRKTQDVLQTPMGYICTGRALGGPSEFQESLS
ncbi:hypothetical protein F4813DRAFT_370697 [Daldinia decipiens]|uniref:uncharacterized protein n=1 Tax=Daldinia decipiens TaxID=326647 RepID=UPI0020C45993|nr:uncharacterized protein F4813DRAFT_370697 [Daldinia decipiens]KAI1654401.1 hypothetical protein F4813DRAFT_370697 [Daldinia decipiens]